MAVRLFADGGSRGNPGPSAIGAVIFDEQGSCLGEVSQYIGKATNNEAEYRSLVEGLKKALELGLKDIEVVMDSQLVVKQILGEYRVKHAGLRVFWQEAQELIKKFEKFDIQFTRRENNVEADKLVNQALDAAVGLDEDKI
jgi:ribonuclease HI